MNGEKKVPPTAVAAAMDGEAIGLEGTEHHGAGDRDRTGDIELGKEHAVAYRCASWRCKSCSPSSAPGDSPVDCGWRSREPGCRTNCRAHLPGGSHQPHCQAVNVGPDGRPLWCAALSVRGLACHLHAGHAGKHEGRDGDGQAHNWQRYDAASIVPAPPISHLLMARTRADAELSACAMAVAKAASVYLGTCADVVEHLDEGNYLDAAVIAGRDASVRSGVAELRRTIEAFRRAEVAHSAALRALEDGR